MIDQSTSLSHHAPNGRLLSPLEVVRQKQYGRQRESMLRAIRSERLFRKYQKKGSAIINYTKKLSANGEKSAKPSTDFGVRLLEMALDASEGPREALITFRAESGAGFGIANISLPRAKGVMIISTRTHTGPEKIIT